MHRAGIDVKMLQRHARISSGHVRHHSAPQLRGFKNVGLVDRRYFLSTRHRSLKCDVGNALDLSYRIAHGVESAIGCSLRKYSAGLTKIKATEKFTHNQNVCIT